jgi:hypothetical protein
VPGSSVLSDLDKSPSAFGCDGNGTERNQVVFYLFWCLYFRCHTPYMTHREGKVCLSSPRHASKAKSLVVLSSHAGVFLHTTTTSRDPYGKKRRVAALPLYNKIYKTIEFRRIPSVD